MTILTPFRDNRQARITRASAVVPMICHLTTPDRVNSGGASGFILFVPNGATSGTLTAYVAATEVGTAVPLIDAAGDAVTISVEQNKAYDLPEALFAAPFFELRAEDAKHFTGTLAAKG